MKRGTQVTLAVLTGYVLGRRRKLGTAVLLGAAAAAGRYSGNPAELLARGRSLIGGSSTVSELGGLAKPLVKAGKAAAQTAVTDRIESVSDRLRDRSEALRSATRPDRLRGARDTDREEREEREERGRAYERGEDRGEDRGERRYRDRDEDFDEDREEGRYERRYEDEDRDEDEEAQPVGAGRGRSRGDEASRDDEAEPPVRRRGSAGRR
ncbi:hypothetical protein GCM10010399_82880 [Dactylosporangium fulvum]|uniref:Uncharacterized protein n=1 Tax=Dactylosporangium fulvum TaxID=53359 RepID=A0ABY5VQF3_9ACTN|nr:hypothetical protein [Dactylosporangium fulvum]UWP79281.1 hypothetical protein Dfulv_29440 [Dactylosporangium fulvum]